MSDHYKKTGGNIGRFVRRIVDGVEKAADRVEDAIEQGIGGEDETHRRHRRRYHHERLDPQGMVINIDVHCCCPGGKHDGGTPAGESGTAGRPNHVTGASDGSLNVGITGISGLISTATRAPNVWPGARSRLFLPLLFLRANAGDTGARPLTGVFWESPDILVLPGVDPSHAPAVPSDLGGVAEAGRDNTIYAHVWNLGQAPCPDTLVEFYWFNPSLGFSGDKANLIGATWVDLNGRGNIGSHKLVKCPISWRAQFLNGGHECLVVRVSQSVLDPLSGPAWDASRNRHVGQRNIHVMSAREAMQMPTLPIAVGPLFGGAAQVGVERVETGAMPWLHLVTMDRNALPQTAAATGTVGLTAPTAMGTPLPDLANVPDAAGAGLIAERHAVYGDGQQVGFHATDGAPGKGSAHIYRVTGTQGGAVFGGYTVVVLG